jgi:hypothetical protein
MIKIVRAAQRHFSDFGWLKTYWLFSFDNYYDPANVEFGSLRVFNDDIVEPGSGFPTHSHREMEIVTLVLSGAITHQDSAGNKTTIGPNEVQRMSAGTGIAHSEMNRGNEPVHLYQVWIKPNAQGITPGYEQRAFDPREFANRLTPVASGNGLPGAVTMHTNSTIYMSELDEDHTIELETHPSRGVFIYLNAGKLAIQGEVLEANDQARVHSEPVLRLQAREAAKMVLIDVPYRAA